MEDWTEKENQLKNEMNEELEKIEILQEEINERKIKIEKLQRELKELDKRKKQKEILENNIIIEDKNDKEDRNNRKRQLEELTERKKRNVRNIRRRMEKLKDELLNEEMELEGENSEEIIEQEEISKLSSLYLQACEKEERRDKKNRIIIKYWFNFAEEYIRRTVEISKEEEFITESTIVKKINKKIEEETGWTRENIRKKVEGARKIYYLFSRIGKEKIKRIKETSANTILSGTWSEIYELEKELMEKRDDSKFEKIMIPEIVITQEG